MRPCLTTKEGTNGLKRVLIVEDDVLLAMHLRDVLTALGHVVFGQATRIDRAMDLARESEIDFATLDINLAGTKSFPVADILNQRGIPFFFATGYGNEGLIDGYRNFPVLRKPYSQDDLQETIARLLAGKPSADPLVSKRG